MPMLYYEGKIDQLEAQSQRNMGRFMKFCWSSAWRAVLLRNSGERFPALL